MSSQPACPKCGYVGREGDVFCPRDGAVLVRADPLVGTLLDNRYEVLCKLGEGGMGTVYQARNKHVPERVCAIKVVKAELAQTADYRKRFLREAQALIRARHRHIVEAYDVCETPDLLLFLVMEFLSGQTLEDAIRRHPTRALPLSQALYIIDQVAEALHHAHNLKIVHRDIKPANIFLVPEGGDPNFVKMVDFGLARLLDQAALTQATQVVGTPGYMAPEIYYGGNYVSPALDVYALGCTLFEMLTGCLPFEFDTFDAVRHAHIKLVPPRLAEKRPGLNPPVELENLVKEMLAKKREERPTLLALRKRLGELLAKMPARTVQSMMFALTDPEQQALHDKKTLLTADAKARQMEAQYQAIEKLELERAQVGSDVDELVDKLLNQLPPLPPGELATLRAQWVENRLREQQVEQELVKVRQRREEEEQAVMRRKSEVHELIDKLRSDIRKRPPQDRAELEEDEAALAQLERTYFAVQLRPQLSERIAKLLVKQQRFRHQYYLCLHKLGVALAAHLRALGRQRPRAMKATQLEGLTWSLEHLGRCNQNVGALVAELPPAPSAGGSGRKVEAGR